MISQIRIRVGEYDFSHVQEQLPYIEKGVLKKIVHPQYNFFTYEYDLALVKLEQSLEFAPHVSPICLPQTESLLIGMNATVTGWGRLSEGGTLPSVLQEVQQFIILQDLCRRALELVSALGIARFHSILFLALFSSSLKFNFFNSSTYFQLTDHFDYTAFVPPNYIH